MKIKLKEQRSLKVDMNFKAAILTIFLTMMLHDDCKSIMAGGSTMWWAKRDASEVSIATVVFI